MLTSKKDLKKAEKRNTILKYNNFKLIGGGDILRIAICDDEYTLREDLREILNATGLLPPHAVTEVFPDGVALLARHKQNHFDIIFLDIEMDGINGITTGRKIRSIDKDVIIIYVTSHNQYVYESFEVEAFSFIEKPVTDYDAKKVLDRALRKYREQHFVIHLKWQGDTHALDISEIIYLTGELNQITFYTKDSFQKCNGKLSDFEDSLAPYGFLRCHRNAMINMRNIKSIECSEIITHCKKKVPMSKRKRPICLRAYNSYTIKYRI